MPRKNPGNSTREIVSNHANAKENEAFEMDVPAKQDDHSLYPNLNSNSIGFEQYDQPNVKENSQRNTLQPKQTINDLKNQISRNITLNVINKWREYCAERRAEKNKTAVYRKGPAPVEDIESLKKVTCKSTYGTLDSDVEELEFEPDRVKNGGFGTLGQNKRGKKTGNGSSLASCRALIVYFSKLAKTRDEDEIIDLNFVESLLQSGADINFSDQHGQTIMHEIARAWHPDVAMFAIQNNADVNKADLFGRTPLHLASAVDYDEMVEFLVHKGADINAVTKGENQTPMHYAAKNNATSTLKTLLKLGAFINARDYKKRTPLFVAAESARSEAARFLLENGAPVGVYDDSGTPCLSLMIEKMPHIAIEAVEQFHNIDRAFRKHYFYLSYLEKDPKYLAEAEPTSKRAKREKKEKEKEMKRVMKEKGIKKVKKEKTFAKVPIEVIAQYNQLDLIMHPVFQRLLAVKWDLFGKWGVFGIVGINLFYTLIWTALGIFLPRHNESYYTPLSQNWWRMVLEITGVLLTIYFIYNEIKNVRLEEKNYNQWRQWRTRQVERDIDYCHPRWPEERKYLDSELQQIRTYQRTYFREPWNIFEWITYFVVLTLVVTRIMAIASKNYLAGKIHPRVYSLGLVVIWLRFMRSCRAFRSLGPFIAILGSVIKDTLKFAFLFFEFFIPYAVGFWILFGGATHGKKMSDGGENWAKFNDLLFSVWQMTLVGDFDWDGLVAVDRLMAQILVGSYFALTSVVCLNLYIALLSDTFSRVYAQAQANAVMQQAQLVISVEKALSKKRKTKFGHYMQEECGPLEVYARDEGNSPDDHENDMFDRVIRQICNRIGELEDNLKGSRQPIRSGDDGSHSPSWKSGGGSGGGGGGGGGGRGGGGGGGDYGGRRGMGGADLLPALENQSRQLQEVKFELDEVKQLLFRLLKLPPQVPSQSQLSQAPSQSTVNDPRSLSSQSNLLQTVTDGSNRFQYPGRTEAPPFIPPGKNFFPPHQLQPPMDQKGGYVTEPENGPGKSRRRRRNRGKKNTATDYDSDLNSIVSEQMPMLHFSPPFQAPATEQRGQGKRSKRGKLLTGSWEDIRSGTDA